jgi:hypothetical protein
MSERPILFSSAMVRALLAGRKTQTRRLIKPQPTSQTVSWGCIGGQGFGFIFCDKVVRCPHGARGDRLWVKETWSSDYKDHYPCDPVWYAADDDRKHDIEVRDGVRGIESDAKDPITGKHVFVPFKWRPSIFMPRERSRITLKITEVRVERLKQISAYDCIAEGIEPIAPQPVPGITLFRDYGDPKDAGGRAARESYHSLWESINGAGSWETNPWVWVISFAKISNTDYPDKVSG